MSPLLLVGVALAGGLGAAARLLVDGVVRARGGRLPWATIGINLSGSLVLGMITGLAQGAAWATVAGTGFLGGWTTFSTASVETVRLVQARRGGSALATGLGQLAGAVLLALAGLLVGRALA